MTSFASIGATVDQRLSRRVFSDLPDSLTVLSIWLLVIGGGLVREILGQTQLYAFGFYTIHSIDPAVVVSGAAAFLHLLRRRLAWHLYTIPALIIVTLIGMNAVRGAGTEPALALLWIRANAGIATMLLLALTMRPSLRVLKTVRRALLFNAVCLCVLLALRMMTSPTLFMTADFSVDDVNDGGRVLSVFGTFLIVLASGLATTELLQRPRLKIDILTGIAAVLPVAIFLTRQGTANIAEFAMLAVIFTLQPGPRQRERFMVGGLVGALAGSVLFILLPRLASSAELAHRTDNLGTRRMVWDALLYDWPREPVFYQYFGMPAGQTPRILVLGKTNYHEWGGSMHSMYYGSLPMMGYVGGTAYLVLLAILALLCFNATRRNLRPISSFSLACVCATAVLSVSYEIRGEAMMGLFMAIAWLRIASLANDKPMPMTELRRQLAA